MKWGEWYRHCDIISGYFDLYRTNHKEDHLLSDYNLLQVIKTVDKKELLHWLFNQCSDYPLRITQKKKKKIPLSFSSSWKFSFGDFHLFKKYLPIETYAFVFVPKFLCCIRHDTTNGMETIKHICLWSRDASNQWVKTRIHLSYQDAFNLQP